MEIITGVYDFSTDSAATAWARLFVYKFPRKVRSVGACLTGFDVEFPDADHEFGHLFVSLFPFFIGYSHDEILYLFVELGFRDQDGTDDLFSGQVRYRIFVELDRPTPSVLGPET